MQMLGLRFILLVCYNEVSIVIKQTYLHICDFGYLLLKVKLACVKIVLAPWN